MYLELMPGCLDQAALPVKGKEDYLNRLEGMSITIE